MGCFCSEEEHPLMAQYRAAKDYATKATLILQVAGDEEKRGRTKKAIVLYGTHLRCMAVHCFKEFDRKKTDELINVAVSCRRIATHRATLQQRAIRKAKDSCCGGSYIPTDPAAPQMLAPWEWSEWLIMCKGSGDIEAGLIKMGLLKAESRQTVALRLAEATRSHINVSPTISTVVSPTISPTIAGPTTHVAPNIVSSNAQTGEGNVTPAVGAGGDAGSSYATAPGGNGTATAAPGVAPPGAFYMVPTPQGMMMVPAGAGMPPPPQASGSSTPPQDYTAFMQQQQAMMMMQQMGSQPFVMAPAPSGSGFVPVFVPPGGSGGMSPLANGGSSPGSLSGVLPPGVPQQAFAPPSPFASAPDAAAAMPPGYPQYAAPPPFPPADMASAPPTPSPMVQGMPAGKAVD